MTNVATVIPWAEVSGRRMTRHGLTDPLDSIPAAAAAMGGTHAQIMSAAELSLGLRVSGATRSAVSTALWDDRSIVKTVGLRGALHLFRTADLPWWLAALQALPRPHHAPDVRLEPAQLDEVL